MPKGNIRITIVNWDRYQRPLRGSGTSNRRRSWVAVSVDLFSDFSFLALPAIERLAWVALLLHAGKVGPTFDLDPTKARVTFDLTRTPNFSLLQEQGLIEIGGHTYITEQDKHNRTEEGATPVASRAKKKSKGAARKLSLPEPPEGVKPSAWIDWVTYKKYGIKPPAPGTLTKLGNLLARHSIEDQVALVDLSIANGWKGLQVEQLARSKQTLARAANRQPWDKSAKTDAQVQAEHRRSLDQFAKDCGYDKQALMDERGLTEDKYYARVQQLADQAAAKRGIELSGGAPSEPMA